MSQSTPSETIDYERHVDGLRAANSKMLFAITRITEALRLSSRERQLLRLHEYYQELVAIESEANLTPKEGGNLASCIAIYGTSDFQSLERMIYTAFREGYSYGASGGTMNSLEKDWRNSAVKEQLSEAADSASSTIADHAHTSWDAQKECHVTVYGGDGV